MVLLPLLIINLPFVLTLTFPPAQQTAMTKVVEEISNGGGVAKLIDKLQQDLDAGQRDQLNPYKNNINVTNFVDAAKNDEFRNIEVEEKFSKLIILLMAVQKAIDGRPECAAPKCQQFKNSILQLTEFSNAFATYGNLESEREILKIVTDLLVQEPLQNQVKELIKHLTARKATPSLIDTLNSLLPTANLTDKIFQVLTSKDSRESEDLYVDLYRTQKNLEDIKAVLKSCDSQNPKTCDPTVLHLKYASNDLYMKALAKAISAYKGRPIVTPKMTTEQQPAEATTQAASGVNTTITTTVTTTTRATVKDETKSTGCCALLCLGAVPSCPVTSQCGCAPRGCSSSCNRGCRSQNNCCCKEKSNCGCDKETAKGAVAPTMIVSPEVPTKSSSTPMIALISAISLIASLLH